MLGLELVEFGQLTLGAQASASLSFRNTSAVEGTLYVNLQAYPEFTLSLAEDKPEGAKEENAEEFDSSALQPISHQQYQLAIGGVTDGGDGPAGSALMSKGSGLLTPGQEGDSH